MSDDKLAAFRAYDFDNDEEWKAYKLNLEVPPGKEALLLKKKAQWYQRNKDPDLDVSLATAASQPAQAPPTSQQEPLLRQRPPPAQPPPQQPAAAAAGSRATAGGGRGASGRLKLGEMALLVAHVVVCASAVVSLLPLNRPLAYRAYFMCLRTALLAFGYKVLSKHGLPRFSPFPAALQAWVQPMAVDSNFFYLMTIMLMLQNPAIWLGVVPVAILSAYHASAFVNSNFGQHPLWRKFGLKGHQWLAANQERSLRACAVFEIAMGFQAILSIFRHGLRTGMLAYVYWNQLRLRYWVPESRAYHIWAWQQLNARAQPLLQSVPAAQRYLGLAQRWFEAAGQQARRP